MEINLGDRDALENVLPFMAEHRICAYCGEYGTDVEHVIPRCTRLPTWTVFACRECNSIASGKLFPGFAAKRQHIRKRLRRKYAKVFAMPEWTDDELAALGPRMRQYVQDSADAREWLHQRLNFDISIQEIIEAKLGKMRALGKEEERVAPMSSLRQAVPDGPRRPEVLLSNVPDSIMADHPVQGSSDPPPGEPIIPGGDGRSAPVHLLGWLRRLLTP